MIFWNYPVSVIQDAEMDNAMWRSARAHEHLLRSTEETSAVALAIAAAMARVLTQSRRETG